MTETAIKDDMEAVIESFLPIRLHSIGALLSAYMSALHTDGDDEEERHLLDIREETYTQATEYYQSLLEHGKEVIDDKPLFPFYLATAYLLCYLQKEMSTIDTWEEFTEQTIVSILHMDETGNPPWNENDRGYG